MAQGVDGCFWGVMGISWLTLPISVQLEVGRVGEQISWGAQDILGG